MGKDNKDDGWRQTIEIRLSRLEQKVEKLRNSSPLVADQRKTSSGEILTSNASESVAKFQSDQFRKLEEQCLVLERENQSLAESNKHLQKAHDDLIHRLTVSETRESHLRRELDSVQHESSLKVSLPSQKDLEDLHASLAAIPSELSQVVKRYYSTEDLIQFLVQCGQYSRLSQCWSACRDRVRLGQNSPGATDFLLLVLNLYNSATPENPCTSIRAKNGDTYNYELLDRVGNSGSQVAQELLPGLISPSGKVACKALVKLS